MGSGIKTLGFIATSVDAGISIAAGFVGHGGESLLASHSVANRKSRVPLRQRSATTSILWSS
jgi:hypothetical protein